MFEERVPRRWLLAVVLLSSAALLSACNGTPADTASGVHTAPAVAGRTPPPADTTGDTGKPVSQSP